MHWDTAAENHRGLCLSLSCRRPRTPQKRLESRFGEGDVVVLWEGSAAEATQPVHAQVVPQPLHRSVDIGHRVAAFEMQRVRLVGSAAHGDLEELVGEGLVNAAGARRHRWGLVWRAFAPPRGRLELAAAEHVRSAVRVSFSGGGGKRGVSAGFSGKGC